MTIVAIGVGPFELGDGAGGAQEAYCGPLGVTRGPPLVSRGAQTHENFGPARTTATIMGPPNLKTGILQRQPLLAAPTGTARFSPRSGEGPGRFQNPKPSPARRHHSVCPPASIEPWLRWAANKKLRHALFDFAGGTRNGNECARVNYEQLWVDGKNDPTPSAYSPAPGLTSSSGAAGKIDVPTTPPTRRAPTPPNRRRLDMGS